MEPAKVRAEFETGRAKQLTALLESNGLASADARLAVGYLRRNLMRETPPGFYALLALTDKELSAEAVRFSGDTVSGPPVFVD